MIESFRTICNSVVSARFTNVSLTAASHKDTLHYSMESKSGILLSYLEIPGGCIWRESMRKNFMSSTMHSYFFSSCIINRVSHPSFWSILSQTHVLMINYNNELLSKYKPNSLYVTTCNHFEDYFIDDTSSLITSNSLTKNQHLTKLVLNPW